jgi:hypothetical protein
MLLGLSQTMTLFLPLLFFIVVVGAGTCLLKAARIPPGLATLGLAPSAGLATFASFTLWARAIGLPLWLSTTCIFALGAGGAWLLWRDCCHWSSSRESLGRSERLVVLFLSAAVIIPVVVLELAFVGVTVPISTHDGAYHSEHSEVLRRGLSWDAWYPPGFHGTVAALLTPFPWIDTAEGAMQLAFALAPLLVLAIFGLGMAIWSDSLHASAGALVSALSLQSVYYLHLFDLWPMATGLVVVLGIWTVGIYYLRSPTLVAAALGGILVGTVAITHGTELYTSVLGAVVILAAHLRSLRWSTVVLHLPVAVGIAALIALPYLPGVGGWANQGGSVAFAQQFVSTPEDRAGVLDRHAVLWSFATGGLPIDVPLRVGFLAVGIAWAFKRPRAIFLPAILLVFLGVTLAFVYSENPAVQRVWLVTYPWGVGSRLVVIPALLSTMLEGSGAVAGVLKIRQWLSTDANASGRRWAADRVRRLALAFGLIWAGVNAALLVFALSSVGRLSLTYSADDAAAMRWLSENAAPGEMVANDFYADAGIWTTFKAGLPVLIPRRGGWEVAADRKPVLDHIIALDKVPEAARAACANRVRYVYHGGTGTRYEPRRFPSLPALRQSDSLEEVFASGNTVVFRTRLICPRESESSSRP